MILLAIETSSTRGSLALLEDGAVLRESHFPEGLLHGREITARLDEMLRLEGLRPRSLGAIAVSSGPGSYTGIRVGVTAAKTLAYSLAIPVVAESSLMVLAANAVSTEAVSVDAAEYTRVVPVLDGRQGCLFWGLFSASGPRGRPLDQSSQESSQESFQRLLPDTASEAAEILRAIDPRGDGGGPSRVLAIGEGADFFLERAKAPSVVRGPRSWDVPSATVLGKLAWRRAAAARFDAEAVHCLAPSYLRVTEAERKLAARGAT